MILLMVLWAQTVSYTHLDVYKRQKQRGAKVLGIVNVVGSSIAREADNVMYTWAGPEIAVATTKAYSSQLIALYLLCLLYTSRCV